MAGTVAVAVAVDVAVAGCLWFSLSLVFVVERLLSGTHFDQHRDHPVQQLLACCQPGVVDEIQDSESIQDSPTFVGGATSDIVESSPVPGAAFAVSLSDVERN